MRNYLKIFKLIILNGRLISLFEIEREGNFVSYVVGWFKKRIHAFNSAAYDFIIKI